MSVAHLCFNVLVMQMLVLSLIATAAASVGCAVCVCVCVCVCVPVCSAVSLVYSLWPGALVQTLTGD